MRRMIGETRRAVGRRWRESVVAMALLCGSAILPAAAFAEGSVDFNTGEDARFRNAIAMRHNPSSGLFGPVRYTVLRVYAQAGETIQMGSSAMQLAGGADKHPRLSARQPRGRMADGRYCWTPRRVAAGEAQTYRLTARTVRGARGRIANRATASSPAARTARATRTVRVTAGQVAAGGVTG